jgi:hypothetical protein
MSRWNSHPFRSPRGVADSASAKAGTKWCRRAVVGGVRAASFDVVAHLDNERAHIDLIGGHGRIVASASEVTRPSNGFRRSDTFDPLRNDARTCGTRYTVR